MNPLEFKKKWGKYAGKETSGYQEHFNDLCRLLGQPTPAEADPTGEESFCFQKRVVKDLELFAVHEERPGYGGETERGFADVWKKSCFAWEYKGKKKNLDAAYQQLLRYRESLANPPLLVVCDFDRYIIRTNFNGTVQETIEFTNDRIDEPGVLHTLRCLFANPDLLRPALTTNRVTEELAEKIAQVARSLQQRESVEYHDARTRAEVNVAVRKNLRVARFLNRITFCFFAEDVGLLPEGTITEVTKVGLDDPHFFAERLQELFEAMAKGGSFGPRKIRHFNGHLFEEATVFELTEEEIRALADASEADWQFIEPSIFGTLFERALDESQRSELGAHYTSKEDIETLVEPVLMDPLRREWKKLKGTLAKDYAKGHGSAGEKKQLNGFLKKLRETVVLDPACGSGNFLYVALQKLLGLEKEVLAWSEQLGFKGGQPKVGVDQLRAIEINPYAYELAQVSVQIGWLQWLRDNGFELDRTPVLQTLEGFENSDALLREVFRRPKNLKDARKAEHQSDADAKGYVERAWPECDVIVGNPPFLGDKLMRRELGDRYVEQLRQVFADRIPGQSDLCCYWFEKARALIEDKQCKRAGLLATQGIRGGANREVLKRIKESGDIFWAISDKEWILAGANVHVSLIGFDDGLERMRTIDGARTPTINANLGSASDLTAATPLITNQGVCFIGVSMHGPFELEESQAVEMLSMPNPDGRANSSVVRPWANGLSVTRRPDNLWTIDFAPETSLDSAALFERPFEHARKIVKPVRDKNRRSAYASNWWLHGEGRPAMRAALTGLRRYVGMPRVAKHRLFAWFGPEVLPTDQVVTFARDDDYFFGVLHSRFHEVWALKQGTRLETRPRYTPTTCFETFPFPLFPAGAAGKSATPEPPGAGGPPLRASAASVGPELAQAAVRPTRPHHPPSPVYGAAEGAALQADDAGVNRRAIAAAAKELNELRENWLNPPEWTKTEILEFPGTVGGPWSRFILNPETGNLPATGGSAFGGNPGSIAPVRYPRVVPKDAVCAATLKDRTLTNLYNERPAWLAHAHRRLDEAVAAAYGWPVDLSDEEILSRLLALNLERAAAEARSAPAARKAQRAKRDDELL